MASSLTNGDANNKNIPQVGMLNLNNQEINRLSHNVLVEELTKRNLSTRGSEYILKARLARNSDWSDNKLMQQPFDFLAVIDFEATCVANPPRLPHPYIQEIIEFPIVLIDVAKKRIVETFRSYCRPVVQPILSDYCKQLTGITQERVNSAPVFADLFVNVEKWLNDRELLSSKQKCLFVTDSPSDFAKYLRMQCELAHIVSPKWAYQWVNVKIVFSSFYMTKSGRIHNMLEKLDLRLDGRLHSGLDDAANIAKIVIELLKDGCVMVPNEFYYPPVEIQRENQQLPTTRWEASRIMCINCSRYHSEDQRSCVKPAVQHRQKGTSAEREQIPDSLHSRFHPTTLSTPANIPSLLDIRVPRVSRQFSEYHQENDMDCT